MGSHEICLIEHLNLNGVRIMLLWLAEVSDFNLSSNTEAPEIEEVLVGDCQNGLLYYCYYFMV